MNFIDLQQKLQQQHRRRSQNIICWSVFPMVGLCHVDFFAMLVSSCCKVTVYSFGIVQYHIKLKSDFYWSSRSLIDPQKKNAYLMISPLESIITSSTFVLISIILVVYVVIISYRQDYVSVNLGVLRCKSDSFKINPHCLTAFAMAFWLKIVILLVSTC